jgi:hypothetical protein
LFGIKNEPMRFVPFAIVLGMVVTACHRPASSDDALRQKLVGTWVWSIGTEGGVGATTLAPDGSFVSKSMNRWPGGSKEFSYEGRWEIKDGLLTFTYLKTSEPEAMPVGKLEHLEIIRADNRELALLDSSENRTNILRRSN